VVQPRRIRPALDMPLCAQRTNERLCDDSTDFARRSRDTVRRGAVSRGETFAGHNEGRRVGAEVEEEETDADESEQGFGR